MSQKDTQYNKIKKKYLTNKVNYVYICLYRGN